MEKRKNKDILKLIHRHTHLKDEDGEDVPFFSFVRDITDTIDLDMSEEQIAEVALENGYKVYKSFPEETMVGGLIICAEGCLKEAIDKMYEEFYGEVPTIEEWPLNEDLNDEVELKSYKNLPFKYEEGHTLDEYMELYGELYNNGDLWDHDIEDLIYNWEDDDRGSNDFNAYDIFWLIDGRFYEVPNKLTNLEEDSDDVKLNEIDLEAEVKKGSEAYMAKFIDEAKSLGATIEFLQNVSPSRKDAFWYDYQIAEIRYKTFVITVETSGSKAMYLKGGEYHQSIRDAEDLEEIGIFTDEQLNDVLDRGEVGVDSNNWFTFDILDEATNRVFYQDDLGYDDSPIDLDKALDLKFYIEEVIPKTESMINDSQEVNEGKSKDPRLANAGVSGYNQPKRTPNHPTKSHIVVAKEGDKIKTIRFGEQGAKTAGKPKKGESERMKAKRKSFKARHAKNIAKGKMSAAYWADKVKW
jgi:hypothetical protein